jgi:short-subunit dehydrogenase
MQDRAKVVLITGASGGVGRAAAREFAARGADVALLARNRDALQVAQREVEALGRRALVLPVDVADATAVYAAAEETSRHLGPIDVWVNNAMVTVVSPTAELDAAELRRVTDVTYHGVVHGTLAALRQMRPRRRGAIVQVGSALAYRSIPLQAAYCGAKAAVRAFTDSLRSELIREGSPVHVTMVHMPALNTPQFDWCRTWMSRKPRPVAPIFQPEVAARAIAWAAAHRRRELFVGASTLLAVTGQKLAPGWLDRYLSRGGYDGQLSTEPVAPDRADNLWHPLPGDFGAEGRFGDEAHDQSVELQLTMNRGRIGALAIAAVSLAVAAYLRRRPPHSTRRGGRGPQRRGERGVTRQTVFERSSATISAPRGSTVTPTGRPNVLPPGSRNPVTKSTGSPAG